MEFIMPRMKFHISDLVALVSGMAVSRPDHPPIGENGVPLPVRSGNMDGIVQLTEFLLGRPTARRINHETGEAEYQPTQFLEDVDQAIKILLGQHPQLRNYPPRELDPQAPIEQKKRWYADYIAGLEQKFGAYLEVEAPPQPSFALTEEIRRKIPGDPPSGWVPGWN